MAKHGAKGLNIFCSHRKNSYTTVSVSFFGLPAVQSSRDTRILFKLSQKRFVTLCEEAPHRPSCSSDSTFLRHTNPIIKIIPYIVFSFKSKNRQFSA